MSFFAENWILIFIALLSGGMLVWPLVQRSGGGSAAVGTTEAVRLINRERGVLIDVAEPGEFAQAHARGARNVPFGLVEGSKELPSNKALPVILMCPTGARAGRAATLLRKSGYERAVAVSGGTRAWNEAALPIARGDDDAKADKADKAAKAEKSDKSDKAAARAGGKEGRAGKRGKGGRAEGREAQPDAAAAGTAATATAAVAATTATTATMAAADASAGGSLAGTADSPAAHAATGPVTEPVGEPLTEPLTEPSTDARAETAAGAVTDARPGTSDTPETPETPDNRTPGHG